MALEIRTSTARVVIYPEYGGMVNNFYVHTPSGEQDVIFGYDSNTIGASEIAKDFRSSILSPYPNRVKSGQYTFQDQTYQLDLNFAQEGHSIHGLLYDQPFEVFSYDSDKAVLKCVVQKNQFRGYPFSYQVEITYILRETCLSCQTKILNTSNGDIPMSFGMHPYFSLSDSVDELELKLPEVNQMIVDVSMIPTGEETKFDQFSEFGSLKSYDLDDGFRITDSSKLSETVIRSKELSLTVRQETGQDHFNFLQVYTPPHRKAIAIEPMSGAANCFNTGDGLSILQAGQEIGLSFEVEVSQR